MQTKLILFKPAQIIIIFLSSAALFLLIVFIFISAMRSSSIFEELISDTYRLEIDLLTFGIIKTDSEFRVMDRVHAENLLYTLESGILRYELIFHKPDISASENLYQQVDKIYKRGTGNIVFSKNEFQLIQKGILDLRQTISESSGEQKGALSFLFILLLLMIVLLLLLFFTASAKNSREKIRHQYEMRLSKNIADSEYKMQNLLSSELHDDIGQMLVFLKLKWLESGSKIDNNIDEIIDRVRSLSHQLRIPDVSHGMLIPGVEELISRFSGISSIKVEYTLSRFHDEYYPNYYPILIFRVIQECLQNAVKHSKAGSIKINLIESAPFLIFRYEDNGIGLPHGTDPAALTSIQDRAKLLRAELLIDENINKGMNMVMRIPFLKGTD